MESTITIICYKYTIISGHCFLIFLTLTMAMVGEGNGNPLQYSCLGNPTGRGACLVSYSAGGHKRIGHNLQLISMAMVGLPWWLNDKESICHCRRCGFDPQIEKIPWRRKWQPTAVFLPGKSHGQRSLVGYSRRVAKSRMGLSAHMCTHTHAHTHMQDSANIFSTKKNSQRQKTNFNFIILELNLFLGKIHFPPQLQNYILYLGQINDTFSALKRSLHFHAFPQFLCLFSP